MSTRQREVVFAVVVGLVVLIAVVVAIGLLGTLGGNPVHAR